MFQPGTRVFTNQLILFQLFCKILGGEPP